MGGLGDCRSRTAQGPERLPMVSPTAGRLQYKHLPVLRQELFKETQSLCFRMFCQKLFLAFGYEEGKSYPDLSKVNKQEKVRL